MKYYNDAFWGKYHNNKVQNLVFIIRIDFLQNQMLLWLTLLLFHKFFIQNLIF